MFYGTNYGTSHNSLILIYFFGGDLNGCLYGRLKQIDTRGRPPHTPAALTLLLPGRRRSRHCYAVAGLQSGEPA
jgi:hypothetical protein